MGRGILPVNAELRRIELLEIDPTTRCNYACAYCRGRDMEQLDLDPATLTTALQTFPDVTFVELHGEGEPMLHRRFFDLVQMVTSRGIRASIYTNGSHLTDTNVERLLDAGLEKIVVSVDSADPTRFHEVRTGQLSEVLAGIERLVSRRDARGLTAPAIGLCASIQRRFVDDIPGLIGLYRSLGLDGGLGYQPLNPAPSYANRYPSSLKDEIISLRELNGHFQAALAAQAGREVIDRTSPHKGFFEVLFEPIARGERVCPWLESGVYVTAKGFVTPCCMLHETEAIGRLGETSREEIEEKRAEMRRQLAAGTAPRACARCEVAALVTRTPGNVVDPISSIGT